jgi:hypothetical protein
MGKFISRVKGVQFCVLCKKTRVLDEFNIWGHWMESCNLTPEQRESAKMLRCVSCDKVRLARKIQRVKEGA